MDRRAFLKWMMCAAGTAGSFFLPGWNRPVWAESAFDVGLRAQALIDRKKFKEAVAALTPAVRREPQNDWLQGLLGRAYFGSGRYREAARAFRAVLRLNPGDPYARMMLEVIKLKPLEKEKIERPLTPLERKAIEEEKEKLRKLRNNADVRSFQIQRIVLDAGHGGFDSGAVGPTGLKEKDVTLDLARGLQEALGRAGGFEVFLTREGDYYVPLGERTATANQRKADLFVSFHINASKNRSAHGSETYYCSEKASNKEAARVAAFENSVLRFDETKPVPPGYLDIEAILFEFERYLYWEDSKRFAHRFQNRFGTQLKLRNRGVQYANFYVLRRAKMPALLLETGFISNPREEKMLRRERFREEIVRAVFETVKEIARG